MFNVFDIDTQEYMPLNDRLRFFAELNGYGCPDFRCCPSLGVHQLSEFPTMQDILAFADGESLNHKLREGVVFKRVDGKLSFKVISNAFLLAEK